MTKKQDEQWGNIELPGLTDEELFNTDWNQLAANESRSKYLKEYHLRLGKEKWNEIHLNGIKESHLNGTNKINHKLAMENRTNNSDWQII